MTSSKTAPPVHLLMNNDGFRYPFCVACTISDCELDLRDHLLSLDDESCLSAGAQQTRSVEKEF